MQRVSQLTTRHNIICETRKELSFSRGAFFLDKCYSSVVQNAGLQEGFHRGKSRNSIDRFLIAILANLVDKRWRKSYIILSTRYANSPLGNACVRAWWPVLSLSADIIFDTRVLFTTLNVTRPTSHLFYISRCYHDRNRVIFTLARSYEYFIEGLSLSAVISGRKRFSLPRAYESRTEQSNHDGTPKCRIKIKLTLCHNAKYIRRCGHDLFEETSPRRSK